ncbi:MAG TPA: multicopper oxidase domain-containing protein [Candidatus Cybelea sp.]|jgi:FtsP/CotA-like multicopper oxidase with cupredoxin domain|nr:multicopper oxidase domain-containing protein [Candidatus Cybelea sp.]
MKRGAVGLLVALFSLVACGGHDGAPVTPVAGTAAAAPSAPRPMSGSELPEPPVIKSVNGVAKVELEAAQNYTNGLPTFDYQSANDVAPTIEVKPGDTIVVNLQNDLPDVPPPATVQHTMQMDGMRPDTGAQEEMNLHFHGLGSSPKRPADDVLTMLAKPGESLHYVVHVPANQEPGLYWYHPHVHGETNFQVGESGMSGAIVVDGLERHLPGLKKMTQRLIVVRAVGLGGDDVRPAGSNTAPCVTKDGLTTTLNNVVTPVITIAPGEKQFFRLVNATGHRTLKLKVDGERLELVAIDGFALDTFPGTPPTKMLSSIIVPPAGRAEFVVTGPANGHARFRTLCYNTGPNGDPDPPLVLGDLRAPARGTHVRVARNESQLRVGEPLPSNSYSTALPPPSIKRVVVMSENGKPQFFINGKPYKVNAPPMFVVHTGTTELWQIENVTEEIHDFHIHQTHFVVEKINGVAVDHPHWADSVVVPHRRTVGGKTVPGTLSLLMDFRDPTIKGEFLFHCHILDHEDQGMMAKIQAI